MARDPAHPDASQAKGARDAEWVILVDEHDAPIGVRQKERVHVTGELHRAVSVFVMDGAGRVLLQRRAVSKYHSGGLWSNTCCGHPRPGETALAAAHRRLFEEMGIECSLRRAGAFTYRAELPGGRIEHEIDHLFVGRADDDPQPDSNEVLEWRWTPLADVVRDCRAKPERYTAWLPFALNALELSLQPHPTRPTGRKAR